MIKEKEIMKKGFMVVLLVLLAGAMVFAATLADVQPAGITLTLDIGKDTQVGWFTGDDKPTTETWGQNEVQSDDTKFASKDDEISLWAAVKTNEAEKIKMEISGEPMSSSNETNTKISIIAKGEEGGFGSGEVTWAESSSDGKLSKTEVAKGTAVRVLAYKVIFSVDGESYDKAVASDNYIANITLTVTADQA